VGKITCLSFVRSLCGSFIVLWGINLSSCATYNADYDANHTALLQCQALGLPDWTSTIWRCVKVKRDSNFQSLVAIAGQGACDLAKERSQGSAAACATARIQAENAAWVKLSTAPANTQPDLSPQALLPSLAAAPTANSLSAPQSPTASKPLLSGTGAEKNLTSQSQTPIAHKIDSCLQNTHPPDAIGSAVDGDGVVIELFDRGTRARVGNFTFTGSLWFFDGGRSTEVKEGTTVQNLSFREYHPASSENLKICASGGTFVLFTSSRRFKIDFPSPAFAAFAEEIK
jgi:hypothetical protein